MAGDLEPVRRTAAAAAEEIGAAGLGIGAGQLRRLDDGRGAGEDRAAGV
jgi:hypothetical protein